MRTRTPSSEVLLATLFSLSLAALGGCTHPRSPDISAPRETAEVVELPTHPPDQAPPRREPARTYALPSASELKSHLSPVQFEVTQNAATEPPFQNAYWNNHEAGIYVDVATGEPLFSSQDKFESGTGWPSFMRPIEEGRIVEHADATLGMVRTEVVSSSGNSHLGHLFPDGPKPTGLRYCINSASLRFVPADRLVAEGYAAYAPPFTAGVASEAAPATSNSCALPPPGETPGCSATLDVAIFARAAGDERIAKPDGVLDVAIGQEGTRPAVEVTYDPSKLTYAKLLATWTQGREKQSVVFARTGAQKRAAVATSVRVTDAVPFRRD